MACNCMVQKGALVWKFGNLHLVETWGNLRLAGKVSCHREESNKTLWNWTFTIKYDAVMWHLIQLEYLSIELWSILARILLHCLFNLLAKTSCYIFKMPKLSDKILEEIKPTCLKTRSSETRLVHHSHRLSATIQIEDNVRIPRLVLISKKRGWEDALQNTSTSTSTSSGVDAGSGISKEDWPVIWAL